MSEQPRKRLTRADAPYALPRYETADAAAFQALERGEADEFQQKRVLKWLIEEAAGTYEFQFYKNDRDTAFSLGRQFVGQEIVKLLRINTSRMQRI